MNNLKRTVFSLSTLTLIVAVLVAPGALSADDDTLTLRLNDAMAEPGDRVAVVLRTYAPRGVGQGQICMAVANGFAGGGPLVELEEVVVFSEHGDAVVTENFDGPSQVALIEFSSASGTINWADGPMAVLFFRLDPALQPGQEFALEMDLGDTFLVDAEGQPIQLRLRGGELTVRAPGEPHELGAEGDEVNPGEIAALGVETEATFAIGSGQVALHWDPAIAAGPPSVTMDTRHGLADFTVDLTVPGRALVNFSSPDSSLNEVPGKIVSVNLPTAVDAPPGSSPVTLDPALTHLEDPVGTPIPIILIADVLDFTGQIFADGFESGDFSRWSVVQ